MIRSRKQREASAPGRKFPVWFFMRDYDKIQEIIGRDGAMEALSNRKLTSRQFFRLLPIQVLLVMVQSVNGIISSIFGSNFANPSTMSAMGLYSPISFTLL